MFQRAPRKSSRNSKPSAARGFAVGTLLFLSVAALLLSLSFFSEDGMPRIERLRDGLEQQRMANDELERRNNRLKQKVVGLEMNNQVLEEEARGRLSLVRENEVMIIFDEDDS